jgi:tetraacyldisaccharide-1-P 4'-kinase
MFQAHQIVDPVIVPTFDMSDVPINQLRAFNALPVIVFKETTATATAATATAATATAATATAATAKAATAKAATAKAATVSGIAKPKRKRKHLEGLQTARRTGGAPGQAGRFVKKVKKC